MKNNLRKVSNTLVILTEISHVFCCVLPTVISLISLASVAGITILMPGFFGDLHDALHHYEIPMMLFSGIMLLVAWGISLYSLYIDCHDTGCEHGPCEPKKKHSLTVMFIATALFLINVTIYFSVHMGDDKTLLNEPQSAIHNHHDH